MAPLRVEHVTKTFLQGNRRVIALDGITLDVGPSRFLAVMGASGSGKSTLLHLMAGLAKPDEGKVLIDDTDITTLNDRRLTLFRRRRIGLVFQSFNLIPTLSAEENIALPLMLEGVNGSTLKEKVGGIMSTLGIESRRGHRPDAMSGGEQQRVAIGRALVTDATVILADEPTGNLDSANSRAVCEVLRDLSTRLNKAIVMVTHEPAVAAYADEVAVIRDGRLIDRFDAPGPEHGQDLAARYQACLSQ